MRTPFAAAAVSAVAMFFVTPALAARCSTGEYQSCIKCCNSQGWEPDHAAKCRRECRGYLKRKEGATLPMTLLSLKSGESVPFGAFYWVKNCKSILKRISGVDILEGPPGIILSIKEEKVVARKQKCAAKVQGGRVIVTAKEVKSPISGTLKFRVRYDTTDGPKQSSHALMVALYP